MKIKNGKLAKKRMRSIGQSMFGAAKATVSQYKTYKAAAPQRQVVEIKKLQQDIKIRELREKKAKLMGKRNNGLLFGNI